MSFSILIFIQFLSFSPIKSFNTHKTIATTYDIKVVTGDVRGAGTDANVFIQLFGESASSERLPLKVILET